METYIHYGHGKFSRKKLIDDTALCNKYCHRDDKPCGLWASPVGARYGWKDWCEEENFHTNRLKKSFKFRLKDGARILHVHSLADAKKYLVVKDKFYYAYALNLKKIYANFDGMELHLSDDWSMRNNNVFNGWDVDSICVWNPDIIINVGD